MIRKSGLVKYFNSSSSALCLCFLSLSLLSIGHLTWEVFTYHADLLVAAVCHYLLKRNCMFVGFFFYDFFSFPQKLSVSENKQHPEGHSMAFITRSILLFISKRTIVSFSGAGKKGHYVRNLTTLQHLSSKIISK